MTINAIQTRYAGCHFRSRLEARWAVALDRLGIRWEYEAQGFDVTWRLSLAEGTFRYLPDFWLPDEGVYAEVKGSLTFMEYLKLVNAAASLSSNDAGGCHDAGGHDLVALGHLPDPTKTTRTPVRLHMHKGDLVASCWLCGDPERGPSIADDTNAGWPAGTNDPDGAQRAAIDYLLDGRTCPHHAYHYGISYPDALTAARSARFEYGERGA